MSVRILKPSIDEASFEGNPCLRGVLSPESLRELRIDQAYQREFLASSTRRYIMDALAKNQRLPDIELGMRGETWGFDGEDVILHDPTFIIDGQQRRGSVLEHLSRFPDHDPRLGCIVHFNSTIEWERERFRVLNLYQAKVSSGVILRNMRSDIPGIATAYGLTVTTTSFALYNKVSWTQSMAAKDLISASTYLRVTLNLHGHFKGGITSIRTSDMSKAFDILVDTIGMPALRTNIYTFWDLLDKCWGVRDLQSRGVPWLKSNFLYAITDLMSDHVDFWEGDKERKFVCPVAIRDKLQSFPMTDPEIKMLAASTGQSRRTLAYHFIGWINKGRRNVLRQRNIQELLATHVREGQALRRGKAKAEAAAH